jgi:hypothetical protein
LNFAELASRCPLTTPTVEKIATQLNGLTHREAECLVQLACLGLSENKLIERLAQERVRPPN